MESVCLSQITVLTWSRYRTACIFNGAASSAACVELNGGMITEYWIQKNMQGSSGDPSEELHQNLPGGLKKTTGNLSQNKRSPGRDLKSGRPECEAWVMLTTRPQCSLLNPIPRQTNPVCTLTTYFLKNHLNIILQNRFFTPDFPTKILYDFLISHTRTESPAHLTLFDLIALVTFSEEHEF